MMFYRGRESAVLRRANPEAAVFDGGVLGVGLWGGS